MEERIYVVVQTGEEGSTVLWAGQGKDAAVDAVQRARAAIAEAIKAYDEILGRYPNGRDFQTVTQAEWDDLHRRQGRFSGILDRPWRVCVSKEVEPFGWRCCCQELGVWMPPPEAGCGEDGCNGLG